MFHVKQSEILAPDSCLLCGNKSLTTHLRLRDYFLTREEFTICRCEACEYMFTWPQPEPKHLQYYYNSPDYISHSINTNDLLSKIYHLVRNHTLRCKVKLIKRYSKGNRLLDIGCATGEFLNRCRLQGFDARGIEPNENARKAGQQKYNLTIDPVSAIKDFEDSSFDLITMWHVLEHVENLHERMRDVFRLLKPQGTLILALPNPESDDARYYGKFWAAWDTPRHLSHFNQKSVNRLAEIHGMKISQIHPMLYDSYYISLLSEKYMKGKYNYLSALLRGFLSNMKAGMGRNDYSSLIYIIKKPA